MNEHTPRRLQPAPAKPAKGPKSAIARRRQLLLILAGVALAVLIGVLIWRATVKPPDIDKPAANQPAEEDEPEKGRDYYEGELIQPFVEDENMTRKEDFYTFLLCGTDEDGTRTDTIIVAAYDVKNQKINMVNVPRDTMSNVKRSIKKINGAFNGGVEQLREELQMLLGFRIDRTVVVDFQGFEDLVNAIGGVEFDVPVRMLYTDPTQDLYIDLVPGLQTLDGSQALQLMRFRQNNPGVPGGYPGGDIERIACQQEFIQAVASQLLSPSNLLKISDIASAILNNTETDMPMGELMWLGIQALKLEPGSIEMDILPGGAKYLWEADYGHMQSYYVPDEAGILEMVNNKLNPYNEPITDLNLIDASSYPTSKPVEVSSGSGEDDEPPETSDEPSVPDTPEVPQDPGDSGNTDATDTPQDPDDSQTGAQDDPQNPDDSQSTGDAQTPDGQTQEPDAPSEAVEPPSDNTGSNTGTQPNQQNEAGDTAAQQPSGQPTTGAAEQPDAAADVSERQ